MAEKSLNKDMAKAVPEATDTMNLSDEAMVQQRAKALEEAGYRMALKLSGVIET